MTLKMVRYSDPPEKDVSQIYENLYLGGRSPAASQDFLESNKITHVLNCTQHLKRSEDLHDRLTYMQVRLQDSDNERLSPHLGQAIEFLDTAIRGGGRVLVHCHMGICRSASMVLGYMIVKNNMSLLDAYTYLKSKRAVIRPRPNFCAELRVLENKTRNDYTRVSLYTGDNMRYVELTWRFGLDDILDIAIARGDQRVRYTKGKFEQLWTEFNTAAQDPRMLSRICHHAFESINLRCAQGPYTNVPQKERQLLNAFCKTLIMGMTQARIPRNRFLSQLREVLSSTKYDISRYLPNNEAPSGLVDKIVLDCKELANNYQHLWLFVKDRTAADYHPRKHSRVQLWPPLASKHKEGAAPTTVALLLQLPNSA